MSAIQTFKPTQSQEEFFNAMADPRTVEAGIVGCNRCGKSLAAAMWLGSLALDMPIGHGLNMRRDEWRRHSLNLMAIGYDERHVREVMERMLLRSSAFKDNTGTPARPIIDGSDIEVSATYPDSDYGTKMRITLKNGTRIWFQSSACPLPPVDLISFHGIWADCKLADDCAYSELIQLIKGVQGKIVWTDLPTLGSDLWFERMRERADGVHTHLFQFRSRLVNPNYYDSIILHEATGDWTCGG